jgi:hypothetical protein
MATIQRNALVAPFNTNAPFMDHRVIQDGKGSKQSQSSSPASSGISRPHVVWLQSIVDGVNASPQITATIPATSASPGQPGTIAFDSNFLYICVGLNIWRRVGINAF